MRVFEINKMNMMIIFKKVLEEKNSEFNELWLYAGDDVRQ